MAAVASAESLPSCGTNYHVDDSVLKGMGSLVSTEVVLIGVEFPEGAKVLEANRYSTAAWTTAIRVIVELRDGTKQSYFLKVSI